MNYLKIAIPIYFLILEQSVHIAYCLLHIPCRQNHHLCGICGICVQGRNIGEDYCETAGYSEGIFNDDAPNCTFVDKCKENPCQNFKRCTSYMAQYFCDCEENFTGINCSLPVYKKSKYKYLENIILLEFYCS